MIRCFRLNVGEVVSNGESRACQAPFFIFLISLVDQWKRQGNCHRKLKLQNSTKQCISAIIPLFCCGGLAKRVNYQQHRKDCPSDDQPAKRISLWSQNDKNTPVTICQKGLGRAFDSGWYTWLLTDPRILDAPARPTDPFDRFAILTQISQKDRHQDGKAQEKPTASSASENTGA
ncbi:hypothetical protein [Cohaesibacter marisflavi]|uniref:hypothetical protein n=1 Tax=Cohaesibacter marisflavi TaxID=655353 RepID=UPI00158776C3